ncbi:MAG: response regulator [Anaerolineae bacterium]|nr:response regulator [Anaerolineae bacterium]
MITKVKILIVEDESIVAMDVKNRLIRLGYEVCGLASSGEEAIQKTIQSRPGLILMDIRLKGQMDGIIAAEQIRSWYDVPIVFLTAYSDDTTLQRAKLTEAFGYLLKPLEERELHITIEMALYKHKMERKLKESEQWLFTTLNSIGEGVIATDAQGYIKFMNPVAEALTGWSQPEALGQEIKTVFNLIHAETRLPVAHPAEQVLHAGKMVCLEKEAVLVARYGQQVPIANSAAPIRNHQETITGVVLIFRDVTEHQQAEAKLRRYAEELESQNEDLEAFARTVAHDLQSPLNPIIGFADVMLKQYPALSEDEIRSFLQIIAQSGRKMSNIIDELMLLAQVRRKKINPKPLDMAEIIRAAQQRLSDEFEAYQAQLVGPAQWPTAAGYAPWIEQVWINYLSNALKYGGRPPRVEVGATIQENGMVRFWVRDNGDGIDPTEHARLFTPFTRLEQVKAKGNGIGLSIVRRMVESLGGQVGVESEGVPGRGSTFSFTLPATNGHRATSDSLAIQKVRMLPDGHAEC